MEVTAASSSSSSSSSPGCAPTETSSAEGAVKERKLDEVLSGFLYLSSVEEAKDLALLEETGISHVLTIGGGMPALFTQKFSYQIVDGVDDSPSSLIMDRFSSCFSFIEMAKEQGGKVLVHCEGGVSRSATVCAAYVMYSTTPHPSAASVIESLQVIRNEVSPNKGFREQLELFEKIGYDPNFESEEAKQLLQELRTKLHSIRQSEAKPAVLNQELFETPPENYTYEIEMSSKANMFIPTILEEQDALAGKKKKKQLAQSISVDDGGLPERNDMHLKRIHSTIEPDENLVPPCSRKDSIVESDDEEISTAARNLIDLDGSDDDEQSKSAPKTWATAALVNLSEEVASGKSPSDNVHSGKPPLPSSAHKRASISILPGVRLRRNSSGMENLHIDSFSNRDEVIEMSKRSPIARQGLGSAEMNVDTALKSFESSSDRPKSASIMPDTVGSTESKRKEPSPPPSVAGDSDHKPQGLRYRTSSSTESGAGQSYDSDDEFEELTQREHTAANPSNTTGVGASSSSVAEAKDEKEEKEDREEKAAATNVVGKVLMGYAMTPSDEVVVSHWLARKPKGVAGGQAFKGLRQALRMMRRFVNNPEENSSTDDQNVAGVVGLQSSLKHVGQVLEKFTGFPLHSPEFMRMLQRDEGLELILENIDAEYKNALDEVRECTSSKRTAISSRDDLENLVEFAKSEECHISVTTSPPPDTRAAAPKVKPGIKTPGRPQKVADDRGNAESIATELEDQEDQNYSSQPRRRRRRSATIDLLLLLAKLGLRRDQSISVSDKAYQQFSQLLEGGMREKAALEDLDKSCAIELLGYLESFPDNIKMDHRIQRLGHVVAARLVLMVSADTASEICDQLLAQPKVTGHVRDVATYAFHFSGALTGTQMTILRKAREVDASTKLSAAFRGSKVRKELSRSRKAAEIIQQWRRSILEEATVKEDSDIVAPTPIGGGIPPLSTAGIPFRSSTVTPPHVNTLATLRSSNLRSWQSSEHGQDLLDASRRSMKMHRRFGNKPKQASETLQNNFVQALDCAEAQRKKIGEAINLSRRDRNGSPQEIRPRQDSHEKLIRTMDSRPSKGLEHVGTAPGAGDNPTSTFPGNPKARELLGPIPPVSTSSRLVKRESSEPVTAGAEYTYSRHSRVSSNDVLSVPSSASNSASIYSALFNSDASRSKDLGQKTINPVYPLQGLLQHLCRVCMSETRFNMEEAYGMQQSLKQLQQHAKNLRAVHPRICVADGESRTGLANLPKASAELAKWLKNHPKKFGKNQTPYVFDYELRVLAFFPPCELDTALQPPDDTSAKFRKILSTVFNLMPCDDEALLDLTETATLSQHASAGYAITTALFYIDKMTGNTDYLHKHHLGDEREGTYGTVAAGYVRYSEEDDRYVFTEESGHYGLRWTLPGTRQSLDKFMHESALQDSYFLRPFFRQHVKKPSTVSEIFADQSEYSGGPLETFIEGSDEEGAEEETVPPSVRPDSTALKPMQDAEEPPEWDFDDEV